MSCHCISLNGDSVDSGVPPLALQPIPLSASLSLNEKCIFSVLKYDFCSNRDRMTDQWQTRSRATVHRTANLHAKMV